MSQPVLDRLRDVVLDNRQRRDEQPSEKGRQVLVDPSGRILIGDAVDDEERLPLSEVHQAVFAAG